MVVGQWVFELRRKSESLMVHLGSEKEIERKREKGRIKNNKEKKIKKGYLIEVVNFLQKEEEVEVVKKYHCNGGGNDERVGGGGSGSGCGGCDCCLL